MTIRPALTKRAIRAAALAVLLAAAAGPARADLDVTVASGDTVYGTLSPADEAETLRFVVPTGAAISVTTKGLKPKGGTAPVVVFAVYDPDGMAVGAAETVIKGTGAKLKKFPVEKSGEHRVVVTGNATIGDYTAKVSWTSPKTYTVVGTLSGGDATYDFDAAAGAKATFVVKAGKGAALPRLLELRDAGGVVHSFAPPAAAGSKSHSEKNVELGATRALTLVIGDAGAGGPFTAKISVKAPKPSKRKFALTSEQLPALAGGALAALFSGEDGGFLLVEDIPAIAGSSVSIPAGAMAGQVAVVIGVAPAVDPNDGTITAGGPAVFFGPEGLEFLEGLMATVTIPFDADAFPDGTAALRVFTQDAEGNVTEILPVTVNVAQGTCTFTTSHFSSFQAFGTPVTGPTGPQQRAKLLVAGAQQGDRFGFWCGIDGPRAVVGAFFGDAPGIADAGVAHVFLDEPPEWNPEAKLIAANPAADERYAECVAISGDAIVVGASQRNISGASEAGAAFVYERSGTNWTPLPQIQASDPVLMGHFGGAVAISGDTIAVGCTQAKTIGGPTTGAVYVFRRGTATWDEEAKIIPAGAASLGGVGSSVALDGDTLIFGRGAFGGGSGEVNVYTRSGTTWTFQQMLAADAPATSDSFGKFSIALSGDTAVIATPHTGQVAAPAPEVYVFTRSGGVWTKQTILTSGVAGDLFGNSVAVNGDRMIVGAPQTTGPQGNNTGLVYLYRRTGTQWSAPAMVVPDDSAPGQSFGSSLGISATRFVVGAVAENFFTGSAYVFDFGE